MNGCGPLSGRHCQLVGLLLLMCSLPTVPAQAGPEQAAALFDLGHAHAQPPLPWSTGIYSTVFATGVRAMYSGMGHRLEGTEDFFVALPAVRDEHPCLDGRMMRRDTQSGLLTCRVIEIRPHGKAGPVIEATVEDIGPWSIRDPYWVENERPDAEDGSTESGRRTNRAGIDLSPALVKALGVKNSSRVDWRFKTDAEGNIVTVTRPEKFRT